MSDRFADRATSVAESAPKVWFEAHVSWRDERQVDWQHVVVAESHDELVAKVRAATVRWGQHDLYDAVVTQCDANTRRPLRAPEPMTTHATRNEK